MKKRLGPMYPSKEFRLIRLNTLREQRDSMEKVFDNNIVDEKNLQEWEKNLFNINYEMEILRRIEKLEQMIQ